MPVIDNKNNTLENWIKAIGQAIIDRAKDVGKDTKNVASVTIMAHITPHEILNFDITKNYQICFNSNEDKGGVEDVHTK